MRVFDETRTTNNPGPTHRKRLILPAPIADDDDDDAEVLCTTVRVSIMLDVVTFPRLQPAHPGGRIPLTIVTPYGERLEPMVNSKSVNKAHRLIREYGAKNVALVLTGRLDGTHKLIDAGVTVNVRAPKRPKNKSLCAPAISKNARILICNRPKKSSEIYILIWSIH